MKGLLNHLHFIEQANKPDIKRTPPRTEKARRRREVILDALKLIGEMDSIQMSDVFSSVDEKITPNTCRFIMDQMVEEGSLVVKVKFREETKTPVKSYSINADFF